MGVNCDASYHMGVAVQTSGEQPVGALSHMDLERWIAIKLNFAIVPVSIDFVISHFPVRL